MTQFEQIKQFDEYEMAEFIYGIEAGTEERIQRKLYEHGITVDVIRIPLLDQFHIVNMLNEELPE